MNRSTEPASKFALPSVCAQVPLPLALADHVGLGDFLFAVGESPQKMTASDHTLRITLASALAVSVGL